MDGSAKRIYEAALGTPADHSVIFLAHNGPTGVSICGENVLCLHGTLEMFYFNQNGNSLRPRFQCG